MVLSKLSRILNEVAIILAICLLSWSSFAQETARVLIETQTDPKSKQRLYSATALSQASISAEKIRQNISVTLTTHTGSDGDYSLEWIGPAEITMVTGEQVASWALRREGVQRFLDIMPVASANDLVISIQAVSGDYHLPISRTISHLGKGQAVALSNQVSIDFTPQVQGKVTAGKGFQAIQVDKLKSKLYQTSVGGQLSAELTSDLAQPSQARIVNAKLVGTPDIDQQTVVFRFTGQAIVTQDQPIRIPFLSGRAALSDNMASDQSYRVELVRDSASYHYELNFPEAGEFDIDMIIFARLDKEKSIDFRVQTADILPVELFGLDRNYRFDQPGWQYRDGKWQGVAAGNGGLKLAWNPDGDKDKAALFFSTKGRVETQIGMGVARQTHAIDYQILQGVMSKAVVKVVGSDTEVVSVAGGNLLSWQVDGDTITIKPSEPITQAATYTITTRTTLGDLPTSVVPVRLEPIGSTRHSGHIRLINKGSVRLEPSGLVGLTQLAPEHFPGETSPSRQTFVYRFPAKDYQFEVVCGRIQPEVLVSEISVYQVADTDRTIRSAVELDIREAPIREWNILVPEDYAVVSVSGSGIVDYVLGSEVTDEYRNLKCIYSSDVTGRKLVKLLLEKNQPAVDGDWALPKLEFPDAESYRGDLGISATPGFRLTLSKNSNLVERPLTDFPAEVSAPLQHYLRMREEDWQANIDIERLPQSVQADSFHLYSLGEGRAFGSVLVNYLITGSPVAEFRFALPAEVENIEVVTKNLRSHQVGNNELSVALHQPVLGNHTLLITFEQDAADEVGFGQVSPLGVAAESGYIQVVSPLQLGLKTSELSSNLLPLDHLELPPEFRLLNSAPSLGIWQYSERPINLQAAMEWLEPANTLDQVVEFSDAATTISQGDQTVTDLVYYVKSQDSRPLSLQLPAGAKIWDVRTNGRSVASRQAGATTQIPMQLAQPGELTEVRLRLGQTMRRNRIQLPIVTVPVLKTQWRVDGDEGQTIRVSGPIGNAANKVLPPRGYHWVGSSGLWQMFGIVVLVATGLILAKVGNWSKWLATVSYAGAMGLAIWMSSAAHQPVVKPKPLVVNLPVIASAESVYLVVKVSSMKGVQGSFWGVISLVFAGVCLVGAALRGVVMINVPRSRFLIGAAIFFVGLSCLLWLNGAHLFFGYIGLLVVGFLMIPFLVSQNYGKSKAASVAAVWFISGVLGCAAQDSVVMGSLAVDRLEETWSVDIENNRVEVEVVAAINGRPGDSFNLVRSPAVLTKFESKQVLLHKVTQTKGGTEYRAVVPSGPVTEDGIKPDTRRSFSVKYAYQLPLGAKKLAIPILTGPAATHQIRVIVKQPGWHVSSTGAANIIAVKPQVTMMTMLPNGPCQLSITPETRDPSDELSEFFVESQQLYIPSPGVVDGTHQFHFRSSRGQIEALTFSLPVGLTVSDVTGPIRSWQFNPASQQISATLNSAQSGAFQIKVMTQSSLSAFPTETQLAPIHVNKAAAETGLIAIGFFGNAQPEKVATNQLSQVNGDDFTMELPSDKVVLHQVYRYRDSTGDLVLKVNAVAPEIRSQSRQIISLGDEDLIYQINYQVEIKRSGVFKLSIPLPQGYEVNSLSGKSLHHWSESVENGQRKVWLHLNGKTIGSQSFVLSLLGSTPSRTETWAVPALPISEANRHTGELILQPAKGIRLSVENRKNVVELDPGKLGSKEQGALAFRTLQKDWQLQLQIENMPPRLTAELLHDLKIREFQRHHSVRAVISVQNAAVRAVDIELPIDDQAAEKTLRISGRNISGFSKRESGVWRVQLKRWTLGDVEINIDWEQRDNLAKDQLVWQPIKVNSVPRPDYYLAVRTTGRLEVGVGPGNRDWRRVDWMAVPKSLRQSGQRLAPSISVRAGSVAEPMTIMIKHHTLAEALKLRIERGQFNTVVSPLGSRMTTAELDVDVIQRSHLTMVLPAESEMFSLFVNGETVQPFKVGIDRWRFPVLPNAIGRQAKVMVIYVEQSSHKLASMVGPKFGVPMENITWNVLVPENYEMSSFRGNLNQVPSAEVIPQITRAEFLKSSKQSRQQSHQEAVQLLTKANDLLQQGQPVLAREALHSLANRSGLDAASNEDARVQLETLQTQQALVGLNSRKQRLFLDRNHEVELASGSESNQKQIIESATRNPVIQLGDLNFRPADLSQLLQGNSSGDVTAMRKIASRMLGQQQREVSTLPGLSINPPYEGRMYRFSRSLQADDTTPLKLEIRFKSIASDTSVSLWMVMWLLAGLTVLLMLGLRFDR